MPKLPPKRELTKVEEGQIIERTGYLFDYFVITSRQLNAFAEAAQRVTNIYSQLSEGLFGPAKALIQAQEKIANSLLNLSKQLAKFNQINFVIPIPRTDFPQTRPLPIYIQPDQEYPTTKSLPSPNKKYHLSLEKVRIENKGFIVDSEYFLRGMTTDSNRGKLFQLMIRRDLGGNISDKLISEAIGVKANYDAWKYTLRDLKENLANNKIKLDIERYRGLGIYKVRGITKYLRRPRKMKKGVNKAKIS
jgi:hypothetical protein